MRIRLMALVCLCLCSFFVSGCVESKKAQEVKKLKVTHLNVTTGLPEQNITSLVAFANKVWAGSKTGLYAYDGVNWAIYQQKNTNSLASDIIEGLAVYDNKLWISTNNGACLNDGNRFSSFYTNGRVRASIGLTGDPVVGTANGIIYRGKNLSKDLGLIENEVTSLCFDGDGNLVVGTRAGISKLVDDAFFNYTGPAKTLMGSSLIEVPPSPANCQLSGNNIKVISKFGSDLAIGTTCGLTITNLKTKWIPYKADHQDFVQKGDGSIEKEWISGNSELPGNIVNALASTENGELLFVGTEKGLAILSSQHKWVEIDKYIDEFPKINVTGLAYFKGNLFASSSNGIYLVENISSLLEDVLKDGAAN